MRIIVVDDDKIIRMGLIKILNKKQDFCREHKNKKYIEKNIVPPCQMW